MRVFVNADERATIKANAKASGLTASSYIRAASLGTQIRTVLDLEAVAQLARLHADQGRLGGLLKMYLQDQSPDRRTAERLLADIETVQSQLKAAMRQVTT